MGKQMQPCMFYSALNHGIILYFDISGQECC